MKKFLPLLILGFMSFSYSTKALSQQTLHFAGGSGELIPVTYDGYSTLTVGYTNTPYPIFRVDWFLPGGGTYTESVYPGGSFTNYNNYDFRISAHYSPIEGYEESVTYYVFY